jgi:pimeloyl-ACP methyl ester carboxylesterase
MRPKRTTLEGLSIRYARGENRSGESILLCSPWPESIFAFLPIWQTLDRDFSLIAVDLPGFGGSEGRAELMSPRAMGEFIVRCAEEFDLDHPHVIAPGVSTSVVLFAAANYLRNFRSLVVGGGASTYPLRAVDALKAIIEAPSIEPYKALDSTAVVVASVSQIRNYDMPDFVRDDYVASYAGTRFVESMAFVRNYPADLPVLADRLSEISTPVQIITGRRDPYVPVIDAELLNRQLPNSTLEVLDCGHFAWEEDAAEYGRIASEWIGGSYRTLTRAECTAGSPV